MQKKKHTKKHHWRIIKTFPRPQPASQVASLSLSPISNDYRQQDKVLLNTHRCSLSKSWLLSGWRCCEAGPSQSHSRLALENRQATAHVHHVPTVIPQPRATHRAEPHVSVFTSTLPHVKEALPPLCYPAQCLLSVSTDSRRPRTKASSSLRRLSPLNVSPSFTIAGSTQHYNGLFKYLLFSYLAISHSWSLCFLPLCIPRVYEIHEKLSTCVYWMTKCMIQWIHDGIHYYQYHRKMHQNLSYDLQHIHKASWL